jgi:hypothetical protein
MPARDEMGEDDGTHGELWTDVDKAVEATSFGFKDRSMHDYERSRASVDNLKAFL